MNTLERVSLGDRTLPLLGMPVPQNDYLPILAVLLVTFVVGVWVNLRGVLASLNELHTHGDQELIRVARLHFTFVVPLERNRRHLVSELVRFLALALPAGSLLIGALLDLWPIISPRGGDTGPFALMVARTLVLGGLVAVAFAGAIASQGLVRAIDRQSLETSG